MLTVVEDDERRRTGEHGAESGHDLAVVPGTRGLVENQPGELLYQRFAGANAGQVGEPRTRRRKRPRLGETQAQRGLADSAGPYHGDQPVPVKQPRQRTQFLSTAHEQRRRAGQHRRPEFRREPSSVTVAAEPSVAVRHYLARKQLVDPPLAGLQGPEGLNKLLNFTRRPAMARYGGDKRTRRSRLVVALLDAAHHGRADAAFRSQILLQYPAAFPPRKQLPAHPGHHVGALTADVITRGPKAVPGMTLPCIRLLAHRCGHMCRGRLRPGLVLSGV